MEEQFLSPFEISKSLSAISEKKATATLFELVMFGILAGFYIAFGANAATAALSGGTLDPGLARVLAGSVFSVGLMLVLIPGSELFTGNILMTVGLIYKRYSLAKMLRNLSFVYLGNLIGSIIIAWLVYKSGLLVTSSGLTAIGDVAIQISDSKLALTFTEAFSRGVLCNMLVCLAVIMCIAARTLMGKILGIFFPIMAFVASGYEHSVANMYFIPAGLLAKGEFLTGFIGMFRNLIPVTLGNIAGGLLIVLMHPKIEERIARLLFPVRKKTGTDPIK